MRTQKEIEELVGQIIDRADKGSKFPGMSYEEGVQAACEWIMEESDDHPMAD